MIYVCGDTHHDIDFRKLTTTNWPESASLTKDDYLIVLGDFALIWYGQKNDKERNLENWYNEKPWTTLFVDGNHENFDRLFSNEFPEKEMFGDTVKQISDSIFYLQRGHIYTIEGKTFFTFGGGNSVDKQHRKTHISWWPQEIPTKSETDYGLSRLAEAGNTVDFILSHTCSHEMYSILEKKFEMIKGLDGDEKSLRDYFSFIEQEVEYFQWHFGHFHDDYRLDSRHFLHYELSPMRIV